VFAFGDSPEMADELAHLVLDGPKRATAGLVLEFERDGEPLPRRRDTAAPRRLFDRPQWTRKAGVRHPYD